MKKLLFISVLFSSLFLSACKEKEDTPQPTDNISYYTINKTITLGQIDSLNTACFNQLYFKIDTSNHAIHVYGYEKQDTVMYLCDGFSAILVSADKHHFQMLNKNESINKNSFWGGAVDTLSLDDFAGKGKKYIGNLSVYRPSGVDEFYYGWVGVELSADKQTLKFIDAASNQTMGRPIKADSLNATQASA